MAHRSMRNDSRVADVVYIKIGGLVLEDFLSFSLYSFSCIAKQVRVANSSDPCLVSIPSRGTSNHLHPNTISQYCHQYHLRPTLPVALEEVYYNVPDIECTVNIVRLHDLILCGTTVKLPILIFGFAISVATISWN